MSKVREFQLLRRFIIPGHHDNTKCLSVSPLFLGNVESRVQIVHCAVIVIAGCGKTGPDPSADITLEDGTIVPVGKGSNSSISYTSLLYNEYPFRNHKTEYSYSSSCIVISCNMSRNFVVPLRQCPEVYRTNKRCQARETCSQC